jgi:hypothetical protein
MSQRPLTLFPLGLLQTVEVEMAPHPPAFPEFQAA